jgi:hypothetical protein
MKVFAYPQSFYKESGHFGPRTESFAKADDPKVGEKADWAAKTAR